MVDPTKLNPRFLRSLLIASDSGVLAGTCFIDFGRFTRGFPSNELPDITVEAAELLLHAEKRFRILHGRRDLQLVADDARIAQQLLRFLRRS